MQQQYGCPQCGSPVVFGVRFCSKCGKELTWAVQQQPPSPPPPQYQQPYQQPQQTPQYQQPYKAEPPKKKTNVWLMGCLGLIVLAAIIGGIAVAFSTHSATKATTPAEVLSAVKVGMSIGDVMKVVDVERFFAVINCSSLSFNNDVIDYVPTKDMESPHFMWLFFGEIVQDLDPAVIGFTVVNDEMIVIGAGHMDFAEAQQLVEWNSGRPFRR